MRTLAVALLALLLAPLGQAEEAKTLADLSFAQSGAARSTEAAKRVLAEAQSALDAGPWSVMDKPGVAASGDKHDYFSVPPYWWPNPKTADGLPYVRRDGETNPDRGKYDNTGLGAMCRTVETLALAYALSGEERYVARAALLLNTWFLDPATKMNPHLNFAQGVPGISKGRPEGIIDTAMFARLLDCVDLLAPSPAMAEVLPGLRTWFGAYLDWLLTSPFGKWEAKTKNNHATCYDVQAVRIAFFVGRDDIAREILGKVPTERINKHIAPDGQQPEEMKRTKSFDYSLKNLEALMDLADLGRHARLDLWGYVGPEGQSIREAFDYVVTHSVGGEPWPGENLKGLNIPRLLPLLQRGAKRWPDAGYRAILEKQTPADWAADRAQLWYPLGG